VARATPDRLFLTFHRGVCAGLVQAPATTRTPVARAQAAVGGGLDDSNGNPEREMSSARNDRTRCTAVREPMTASNWIGSVAPVRRWEERSSGQPAQPAKTTTRFGKRCGRSWCQASNYQLWRSPPFDGRRLNTAASLAAAARRRKPAGRNGAAARDRPPDHLTYGRPLMPAGIAGR